MTGTCEGTYGTSRGHINSDGVQPDMTRHTQHSTRHDKTQTAEGAPPAALTWPVSSPPKPEPLCSVMQLASSSNSWAVQANEKCFEVPCPRARLLLPQAIRATTGIRPAIGVLPARGRSTGTGDARGRPTGLVVVVAWLVD
eukprot:781849-Amphidinium_carterae.2